MLQELFRIPYFGTPIYSYGLMMVCGFLGGLLLARYLARRSRIDPEIFVNCAIIALVSGIAGARLSHVLENLGEYSNPQRTFSENFFAAINIREGGLTFYGGFLLAFPCCVIYALYKKMPVKRGMDIVAPCLMFGLGFGRIGCYLNGCCEGAECQISAPLGAQFPYATNPYIRQLGEGKLEASQLPPAGASTIDSSGRESPLSKDAISKTYASDPAQRDAILSAVGKLHSNTVYAAQLFSTLTAWLIAIFLVAYYWMPHAPGRVFAMMLMVESPARFLLEMLRAEPPFVGPNSPVGTLAFLPNLSFSMVLAVALLLLGIGLWILFRGPADDLTQPEVPPGLVAA